ncbi:AhpD-like protein [Thamnocephalis sphaerospora]|uniref:AhpD-like protein n=1 Tax=Thamnocephalis sphaerospora TaxID=78915 RepID=A0A4P9XUH8_9FUNG|nr:AhpD-like protein [Thamnocephalis sphaerospora]|eukprot:RKP09612.1 AhpD-like protein [Thamnocephalis sphaerospora]
MLARCSTRVFGSYASLILPSHLVHRVSQRAMSARATSSPAVASLFTDQDIAQLVTDTASLRRPFGSALVSAVFAAANQPQEAGRTLSHTLTLITESETGSAEASVLRVQQQEAIQLTREALLKAAPLCGFPRIINAMNSCVAAVDPRLLADLPIRAPRAVQTVGDMTAWYERGRDFFTTVYAHHTGRVLSMLKRAYPDMAEVIIQDMYGKILSDPRFFGAMETELLAVGVLGTLEVPAQLRGHVGGARNAGATPEQIEAVQTITRRIYDRTRTAAAAAAASLSSQ